LFLFFKIFYYFFSLFPSLFPPFPLFPLGFLSCNGQQASNSSMKARRRTVQDQMARHGRKAMRRTHHGGLREKQMMMTRSISSTTRLQAPQGFATIRDKVCRHEEADHKGNGWDGGLGEGRHGLASHERGRLHPWLGHGEVSLT